MSWRKHFTPVDNSGLPLNVQGTNTSDGPGFGANQLSSWLPEVYSGSPNRLMRYLQYDNMDTDTEPLLLRYHCRVWYTRRRTPLC